MKRLAHVVAGGLALILVATFWMSTVVAELFLGEAALVMVKSGIVSGMWLLIPALAVTGISGFRLSRSHPGGSRLRAKQKRMACVALNGILILLPAALWLKARTLSGDFGTGFAVIQAIELIAGGINIGLMALNFRDGLMVAGRWRPGAARVDGRV